MAELKPLETTLLETLLEMNGGHVLNFSHESFRQFIRDSIQLDIQNSKIDFVNLSKARSLRKLWIHVPDRWVGKLIEDIIEALMDKYSGITRSEPADEELVTRSLQIAYRLQGKEISASEATSQVDDFMNHEFDEIDIGTLSHDGDLTAILKSRIQEVKKCLHAEASLSVIFMCGSILEGLLLSLAQAKPKEFNLAKASPKELSSGKAKPFGEWSLLNFIDVAHELGILGLDVKKHSHSLRDFRNYIHPFQQMTSGFCPDLHTARICWQVLKAALHDIHENMKGRGIA
ncbi:MAG: hypothetical protein IPL32_04010 [Chloracidobacterium sp.]|nr:hypothetical protein [Chloracidobacterium sp.]